MIKELQTDDVLYQVNILELLSRLVVKPHGIGYLVQNGGLQTISDYVISLDKNPMKGLLIPGMYSKFDMRFIILVSSWLLLWVTGMYVFIHF